MNVGPSPTDLEGNRVRLRPPTEEDAKRIFAWYNEPEIVAPYDRFSVDTYDDFVQSIRDAGADPTSLAPRYVVTVRGEDAPIGLVGHYTPHPVLEIVDVWYVLGDRKARGKGYATEAVTLLVGHLFGSTPYPRVGATVDVENVPSVGLLERVGFRREGVLRSALFHHARWHDIAVYGVTRADWSDRHPAA